ncbi:MAG TPA: hypothetical protein VMT44_05685 [Methanoregula sp.]|nr:hypothetical protein [Methanoregula sp.]
MLHIFMNFEEIESIADLETVAEGVVWQHFERLTGFIFEQNDFSVRVNTVKTRDKKRRQYDVIARKGDRTFLAECKKWAGSRYRLSALKKAIVQHTERTAFYEEVTGEEAVPLIVTLIEEEVLVCEGVPIVPVTRLNTFISEFENHAGGGSYTIFEDGMAEDEGSREDDRIPDDEYEGDDGFREDDSESIPDT